MLQGEMLKVLAGYVRNLGKELGNYSQWKGLHISYEKPFVDRVYTDHSNGIRLSLHTIHPCERGEPFLHPHPWPSAIFIVEGAYEMEIGYSPDLVFPEIVSTQILTAGSCYEMVNPNTWHSVRPIGSHSKSIMVNGPKWDRPMPKLPDKPQATMPERTIHSILIDFKRWHINGDQPRFLIDY
jgi:hypothetical protein